MIELELRYLAKYLPEGLRNCPKKEIIDIYIPGSFDHPKIRIRKNGDSYAITKKAPTPDDPPHMTEQTIDITKEEFDELSKFPGKKASKVRYHYQHKGHLAEFDIFQEALTGLVIIDFEFENREEEARFSAPDFCLADITKGQFAGGAICGKSYDDIQETLGQYNYKKLKL